MSLDAAATEVIRSYLGSAAEEMRRTLIRTAFNPVIYEVLDFGISIFNRDLDLIADAPGLAFFLGANDYAINKGLAYIGRENLHPGDIVLMNYPYWNSAHAMDITLFAGVFADGENEPFAYTCIRAHWMDLGAKDAGYVLDSTDMHQEGMIFPGTKVYKRGKVDREIIELIRFNSRMPDLVLGDLDAQVASTRTGERRLREIYRKFGAEAFKEACDRIMAHGEAVTRRALQALPRGSWTAEDLVDDDGITDTPVPIKVRVTIDDNGLTCDFSESSPAVRGPINVPFGLTQTICKFVLKSLTTPHVPSNAGHFRALRVIAQEGNLFHAVYPAATFTLWTSHLALELIYKALAQGMADRLAASSGGDVPGFMMVGHNPETGQLYAVSNNDPVGWGGTAKHDGVNATNHLSGSLVRNTAGRSDRDEDRHVHRIARPATRYGRRGRASRRRRPGAADQVRLAGRIPDRDQEDQDPALGLGRRPGTGAERHGRQRRDARGKAGRHLSPRGRAGRRRALPHRRGRRVRRARGARSGDGPGGCARRLRVAGSRAARLQGGDHGRRGRPGGDAGTSRRRLSSLSTGPAARSRAASARCSSQAMWWRRPRPRPPPRACGHWSGCGRRRRRCISHRTPAPAAG